MENVKIIRFLVLSIIIITSLGCNNEIPKKRLNDIIYQFESLDKRSLININASVRSRDYNDNRITVAHYYLPKGFIFLKINEQCEVFDNDKSQWKDTFQLENSAIDLISKSLCEIGLNAISVDSCGNSYFSVSDVDNYEFVIVENKNCLDPRFDYKQYKGKCYTVKY